MADNALIEVFGPLAAVEEALLDMPELKHEHRNRLDYLVLDAGDASVTVGDTEPTLIHVTGRLGDVMPTAGDVYRALATRVTYPMRLLDDTDEIVQVRGAVPTDG